MFPDTTILVAGTETAERDVILDTLGNRFHILTADTLDEASGHLHDSIDLVISDLDSRRFSGMELLRLWKARQSETPFVVLTGGRDVAPAVEAMKNGTADCIVKPIDPRELRSIVLQLVESRLMGGTSENDMSNGSHRKASIDIPPGTSLEDLERAAVEQALMQHHGNRTHAAKTLGISVRTLQRKLKAWGMPILSFQSSTPGNPFAMPTQGSSHHLFTAHAH